MENKNLVQIAQTKLAMKAYNDKKPLSIFIDEEAAKVVFFGKEGQQCSVNVDLSKIEEFVTSLINNTIKVLIPNEPNCIVVNGEFLDLSACGYSEFDSEVLEGSRIIATSTDTETECVCSMILSKKDKYEDIIFRAEIFKFQNGDLAVEVFDLVSSKIFDKMFSTKEGHNMLDILASIVASNPLEAFKATDYNSLAKALVRGVFNATTLEDAVVVAKSNKIDFIAEYLLNGYENISVRSFAKLRNTLLAVLDSTLMANMIESEVLVTVDIDLEGLELADQLVNAIEVMEKKLSSLDSLNKIIKDAEEEKQPMKEIEGLMDSLNEIWPSFLFREENKL